MKQSAFSNACHSVWHFAADLGKLPRYALGAQSRLKFDSQQRLGDLEEHSPASAKEKLHCVF